MAFAYQKVKSVAKNVLPKGEVLDKIVLQTMGDISSIVGSTLGPGGRPVLIERQEWGLPAMVTKDGVTVFRNLGFKDPIKHVIMEAARDASVRTNAEAGDGTTTATVLADAIVRRTMAYCAKNPTVSPMKVVRRLEELFHDFIEPTVNDLSIPADTSTDDGLKMLESVATVSANGDKKLAGAVMECFNLVGDDGNVTITEMSGPSTYEVEKIDGYPIAMGYEDSCSKFYPMFINDPGNQRVALEKPIFIVYHGKLTEMQTLVWILEGIATAWQHYNYNHNVVLVATGFSETVLGSLALNMAEPTTINVFPLLAPQSPLANGQLNFLQDLAAIAGTEIFDPIHRPLDGVQWDQLVAREGLQPLIDMFGTGVTMFEASRFRSNIVGHADEDQLIIRIDELQTQLSNPVSELDKILLQERIGKLSGGIARLKVIGASNGELKEKRDRAEDAVSAVRGTIKHGCLPGGGWTLYHLTEMLSAEYGEKDGVVQEVLIPAFMQPINLLFSNIGITDPDEITSYVQQFDPDPGHPRVYDALENTMCNPLTSGILDSVPAVLEAIRNSISIAGLLGTLGGTVVFERDTELEREEARATNSYMRDADMMGEADRRG